MRAIGYLSQSAERQDPPSLVVQNANFLDYCQRHGFEATATFLDAEAAPDRERSGLQQLLRHLNDEARGFTFVIVQSFDYLGHDAAQAARTALQLRARGVRLISLDEGPIDEAALIELWRLRSGPAPDVERRRERLREKARLGQAIGRPPYGYRVGGDGRYEVDEAEAAIVRRIFSLYLHDGLGIRRIVQRLNGEGARTRRGRNWSMITIRDLLRNPVYIGRYDQLGVRVPGNHDAIVSEPDFLAVSRQMEQRRTAPGVGQPSDFLLAGLVWCGEDQSRMIGVTRRRQRRNAKGGSGETVYRYYQSEARTNQSVGGYHTRQADELEAEVLAHIRGERRGGESAVLDFARDGNALAAETVVAVATGEARLRAVDRKLGLLLDDAAAGDPSVDGFHEAGAALIAEWESASADLAQIRRLALAQDQEAERRRRREQRIRRVRDDWDRLAFAQQRDLIEHLVERIVVFDDSVTTQLRA